MFGLLIKPVRASILINKFNTDHRLLLSLFNQDRISCSRSTTAWLQTVMCKNLNWWERTGLRKLFINIWKIRWKAFYGALKRNYFLWLWLYSGSCSCSSTPRLRAPHGDLNLGRDHWWAGGPTGKQTNRLLKYVEPEVRVFSVLKVVLFIWLGHHSN